MSACVCSKGRRGVWRQRVAKRVRGGKWGPMRDEAKKKAKKGWVGEGKEEWGCTLGQKIEREWQKKSGLDYKCILRKKRGRGGRCAHINLAFFPFKLHQTAVQLAQGFQDRLFSFFFSMSLTLLCWKSDSLNPAYRFHAENAELPHIALFCQCMQKRFTFTFL